MAPSVLQPSARYEGLPLLDSATDQLSQGPVPASPHLVNRSQRRRTLLEEVGQSTADKNRSRTSLSPSSLSASASAYAQDEESPPHEPRSSLPPKNNKRWRPWLLRPYVMIVNIVILVLVAATLEVILRINHHAYGWGTPSFYSKYPQIHVLWTVTPGKESHFTSHITNIYTEPSNVCRFDRLLTTVTVERG